MFTTLSIVVLSFVVAMGLWFLVHIFNNDFEQFIFYIGSPSLLFIFMDLSLPSTVALYIIIFCYLYNLVKSHYNYQTEDALIAVSGVVIGAALLAVAVIALKVILKVDYFIIVMVLAFILFQLETIEDTLYKAGIVAISVIGVAAFAAVLFLGSSIIEEYSVENKGVLAALVLMLISVAFYVTSFFIVRYANKGKEDKDFSIYDRDVARFVIGIILLVSLGTGLFMI